MISIACGCCSSPSCGQVCVTEPTCGGVYPTGDTVTLTGAASAGPCTMTGGQVIALALTNPGSLYTQGTNYALGFVGGSPTTPATGLFDVNSSLQVTNLRLTGSGAGYTTTAPTLDFSVAQGRFGSGATGTGTLGSQCCIPISTAGTYNVLVNGLFQGAVTATCTGSSRTVFNVNRKCIGVLGCNNLVLGGATVTMTGTGVSVSGTTGADGRVLLPVVDRTTNQSYTLTVSRARFTTGTATVTFASTGASVTLAFDATGNPTYICSQFCADPVPKTLFLSDTTLGVSGTTLTYSATGNVLHTSAGWYSAAVTISYPGCSSPACAAVSTEVMYSLGLNEFLVVDNRQTSGCPSSGSFASAGGGTMTTLSCIPVSLTFAQPSAQILYCAGTSTITVTE